MRESDNWRNLSKEEFDRLKKLLRMVDNMGKTEELDGLFYCLDCSIRFPLSDRLTYVNHLSPDMPEYKDSPVDIWEFCPDCYAKRFHTLEGDNN